jgi:dTDP-4-dehydrorhamnose reductase
MTAPRRARTLAGPILLTGASGQVGYELRRELAPLGAVVAPPSAELDLARPDQVREAMRALRPRLVVNAAAYTAVDRAESEPERCAAINTVAAGVLAEEVGRLGGTMVHYSTDYVFDGAKCAPYLETDATEPINVYGRTKLAGERAIAEAGGAYLILRTSWVYGVRGANFLRTILRLARERGELRVVNDQWGSPTWARALAAATALIVSKLPRDQRAADAAGWVPWGVYHLSSSGATTWWEFARAIVEGAPGGLVPERVEVTPIATAAYPTAAQRPRYSVLDCGKLHDAFGVRLPHWREQLRLALAELGTSGAYGHVHT